MSEKIYVRLIDGAETWVPVSAREIIAEEQFEILEDDEYNNPGDGELFEFYPGDIVEVEDAWDDVPDGEYQFAAKTLISPANNEDRKYLEFKFKATIHHIAISEENYNKYRDVIERISREREQGKFFYRNILETIEYLNRLRNKTNQ